MEEKDYMQNEYGIVVECAYNNLQKKLDSYVSTPVIEDRKSEMFKAFGDFLNDLKQK